MPRPEPAGALPPPQRGRLAEAEELAEIEADLALARARVAASVHALGEEVSRRFDWRAVIRNHPVLAISGALALGVLAGGAGRMRAFNPKRRSWTWMS